MRFYLHHFYEPPPIMWERGDVMRGFFVWKAGRVSPPEACFVAIQDYVRSIAATETVSKDQVFRFLEKQFALADKNHDGQLDIDELALFARAIACPDADQR
jgi:hypothetical protein